MNYLYRLIRHPIIYLAFSTLLVLLTIAGVINLANRNIEDNLDIPLVKTLGTYVATLEGGTINSRVMGAAILFGLQNQKAKQEALGTLPPDEAEIVLALESIRTQYFADLVFLVNKKGIVVAYTSNDNSPGIGRDLSFRPYVKLAIQGSPNVYPGVGVISPERGIYLSAPLRAEKNKNSPTIGAVVVKIGGDKLDGLLKTWTGGAAMVVSPQGVVFASSRDEWRFRIIERMGDSRLDDIRRSRQFGNVFDLAPPLPLSINIKNTKASIDGIGYAVRSQALDWSDPEGDWMLTFMERRAPWWTNLSVLAIAGLVGFFASMALFWFYSLLRNADLLEKINSELSGEVVERKRAETQITRSMSLLNATLESAKDAILVVDLNNNWVLYNHKFIELWHFSDEIITNNDDKAALSFVLDQLESPDVFINKVKELYAIPEASSTDIIQFKDGKIIERYSIPQMIDGNVVGRVWSFHDVTENKQAERQLNNLLAFNKTILDKSPAGIAVYSHSGLAVMANESYAKAIGANAQDMSKHNIRNSDSWKRNGLLDFANLAFESGEVVRRKIEGTTSFGKLAALECIFAPIDISGNQHLLVITNDISEQLEAENALKESMRQLEEKELAKTRFLAAAGHDLRQPLAAANLFIDALRFSELTPNQNQIIQRLDQAMVNFNGLLESLLNISKLDAGVIKPKFSSIRVTDIFDWLEQNFALQSDEKKLGFKLHYSAKKVLVVYSDFDLIKSVLLNLVSNALKFTTKGAILISARQRGGEVLFQVWDTGIGIQNEQIEHIYDEFYQINNPQRDRASGLGLGLSIAKRAMALLDRTIDCRSRVGRGSVFGFSLPIELNSSDVLQHFEPVANQADIVNHVFAQGKRFVVVEDDALVAEAISNTLRVIGGQVECFHNAEDALTSKNIGQADYYIVDYMLGGSLSGIQFLNQLHDKFGKVVNAVLVTGDTSPTFVRGVENFGWPVLHKPVNISKVLACLSGQVR